MPCCSPPPAATRPPSPPSSPGTGRGSSATRPRAAGATRRWPRTPCRTGSCALTARSSPARCRSTSRRGCTPSCATAATTTSAPRGPTSPLPPELPGGAPSAFEVVEQGERLAGALDAVERLPSAQRNALVGRELEGRSYEELARRQATTVPAVKSLLHRARTALAHQASMPAFVAPFIARLARVRPGQLVPGMVAEHATGAAAIATIAWRARARSARCTCPGRHRPRRPPSRRPRSRPPRTSRGRRPRRCASSTTTGAAAPRTPSTRTARPRCPTWTRRRLATPASTGPSARAERRSSPLRRG